MIEEFGSALVRYPNDGPEEGKGKIRQLPSPEELKGRILLKTKNLMLGGMKTIHGYGSGSKGSTSGVTSSESDIDLEPSSSASESDGGIGIFGRGLYRRDSERKGAGKKKSGEGSGDLVRGEYTIFFLPLFFRADC